MNDQEIIKYISGKATGKGKVEILNWITQNDSNKQLFIHLKNVYALSRKDFGSTDIESEYLKLNKKLFKRNVQYLKTVIKYAAIIIVTIGLTWFIQYEIDTSKTEVSYFNKVICPPAQISEVVLSDGTHVWLNAESSISYPSAFNNEERSVVLNGEAFFEVAKNQNIPFIVKTRQMDIKVLGTSFNVNAYEENQSIQTTLVEGNVELLKKNGNKITVLTPGQQARFDLNNRKVYLSKVDTRFYSSWKEGKITFMDEPLEDIVQKLERWYNVKFVFSSEEIKSYRFTGTILKYKPLDQVLQIIKISSPINYSVKLNSEKKNEILLTKLK